MRFGLFFLICIMFDMLRADEFYRPVEELSFYSDIRSVPIPGKSGVSSSDKIGLNEGVFSSRTSFSKDESLIVSKSEVRVTIGNKTFEIPIENFNLVKTGRDVRLDEEYQVQFSRSDASKTVIAFFKRIKDTNKGITMMVKYTLQDPGKINPNQDKQKD